MIGMENISPIRGHEVLQIYRNRGLCKLFESIQQYRIGLSTQIGLDKFFLLRILAQSSVKDSLGICMPEGTWQHCRTLHASS